MPTSKDSLLKGDEMLFVLLCFAMDNICDVHNCNGKDIRSIIAKQQETPGKLILRDTVFYLLTKQQHTGRFLLLILIKEKYLIIALETVYSIYNRS